MTKGISKQFGMLSFWSMTRIPTTINLIGAIDKFSAIILQDSTIGHHSSNTSHRVGTTTETKEPHDLTLGFVFFIIIPLDYMPIGISDLVIHLIGYRCIYYIDPSTHSRFII